jgi:hexosaminidase
VNYYCLGGTYLRAMKFFSLVIGILLSHVLIAQNISIIPRPQSVTPASGQFLLNTDVLIGMNDNSLLPEANYLQSRLQKMTGISIAVDPDEIKAGIDFKLINAGAAEGAYALNIIPGKITITATDAQGIFYGIVSLLQIAAGQPGNGSLNLPACQVNDAPRFQWRGFMLDESRHFFGKEKVKQLLDWMAFYKLDRFHWHLTDVDGWRIEIKKYPKLTAIGAIGNHTDSTVAAQFYTRQDIQEIVAYAAARFITVIPEIDMPGHATAANRAYPQFDGGSFSKYRHFTFNPANDSTYTFLADILHEVKGLFPSGMIHLGGDEVAFGIQAWAGRPGISEMMAKYKFTTLADLEHYFFVRMADTVIKMGDKVLCWDEAVSSNLPASKTIVFWWRQDVPSQLELALQKNYDVVLCPRLPLYLDFVQDRTHVSGRRWNNDYFNSVNDIYNFPDKQLPADEINNKLILGVQSNIWTETVGSAKRLDFLIFPRIAALAEAAWTNSAGKDQDSFNERLKAELPLYDKDGIYYYNPFNPAAHPEPVDFAPAVIKVSERGRHHKHAHYTRRHHTTNEASKHPHRKKKQRND